ncbi:MAG TPA: class I SAM-dependent methyltransferase [bacterium]
MKDETDIEKSSGYLRRVKALRHFDYQKNWDLARAMSFILQRGDREAAVLDVGCGWWGGMLLPSLARHGYRNLNGCDDLLPFTGRVGPISFHKQDFLSTGFPSSSFEFVTCLSVIEHGVDQRGFFLEAQRLLRPNGYLVISTDYWHDRLFTADARAFGRAWRTFDRGSVGNLLELAHDSGFSLLGEPDLMGARRVVTWQGLSYTFLFLLMQRRDNASP